MSRINFTLVVLALLFASSCGVDRQADEGAVLDTDPEIGDEAAADETDDGDTSGQTDGDDSTESTTAPPTTLAGPTTTAPAGDVALTATFADGTIEILHGDVNDIVGPTTQNQEFVDLVFGGVPPVGFDAGFLTERLVSDTLGLEIESLGGEITDADLSSSRDLLLTQVETLFPTATDPASEAERLFDEIPYLQFLAQYQAGQDVLTATISEQADPDSGDPCVRHILLDTEDEAVAALDRLADGEDFGELAIELSTGPSGPSGGELGCAPSSNYVGPFAAAVDEADLGEFVGPVETEFGFHVIVVERYQFDGRSQAADRLRARLAEASIEVDERIGQWDPLQLTIVPAGS